MLGGNAMDAASESYHVKYEDGELVQLLATDMY